MFFLREFSHVFFSSAFSIIVLFLLTKIMGYRQLTQLSFFDYVIGITIGSIAAEMATDLENEWWKPVAAMVIYALGAIASSVISLKSIKARKFFTGAPLVMMYKGKIIYENMKKARYDINDLLSEARIEGYFDISEIEFAIMEHNGKVSFLPKTENKLVTKKDMNVAADKASLTANLVIDGEIVKSALAAVGKNETWLRNELKKQKLVPKDLALVTYDGTTLTPFMYEKDRKGNNLFM